MHPQLPYRPPPGVFRVLESDAASFFSFPFCFPPRRQDPLKNVWFREFSRMRRACVVAGKCDPTDPAFRNFDRLMTKIPEHTWGEDTTWYLHDYDNWTNTQVNSAMMQVRAHGLTGVPLGGVTSSWRRKGRRRRHPLYRPHPARCRPLLFILLLLLLFLGGAPALYDFQLDVCLRISHSHPRLWCWVSGRPRTTTT